MFIREGEGNRIEAVTSHPEPVVLIKSGRGAQARSQKVKIAGFVEVMGWKAIGNKLADFTKSTEFEWAHKEEGPQGELF
jgi:topoisomerase-4 subunit A